jgi:hypothetical protein
MKHEISWPGVAALAVVVAGAVAAASVTGSSELALVLAGVASGILVPGPLRRSPQ